MDKIKSIIRELRTETADFRWFVPDYLLDQTLSRKVIGEAVKETLIPKQLHEEVSDKIERFGKKIFAILVVTDQADSILSFISGQALNDEHLRYDDNLAERLALPNAKDFREKQWEFVAPLLLPGLLNLHFNPRSILPFLKEEYLGHGAFGHVYGLDLHPGHQSPRKGFEFKVVRKELENSSDHEAELENLSLLNQLQHPNIVKLVASYSYRGKHNLIFPFADSRTLADLLQTEHDSTRFTSQETALAALVGLSSAIEHVHNFAEHAIDLDYIGCHHDLRPRNILVSGNAFILADFGLSRLKPTSEGSKTISKDADDYYVAPECEDLTNGFQKLPVGRANDVWSFGCVLAELAVYIHFGPLGVQEFKKERKFEIGRFRYFLFHKGVGKENEAVNKWLSKLRSTASGVLCQLADLIGDMLSLEPTKRPKATEITARLRLITLQKIATTIGSSLDKLLNCKLFKSMVERTRFDAWRYALGIFEPENMSHIEPERMSPHNKNFEVINGILLEIKTIMALEDLAEVVLVRQLHCMTGRLNELLNETQRGKFNAYFRIHVVEMRGNHPFSENSRDLLGSSLGKQIVRLESLKNMTSLMRQGSLELSSRRFEQINIGTGPKFGYHELGWLNEQGTRRQVLVEYKQYGCHGADMETAQEILVRVEAISALLGIETPQDFHSLQSLGFYHDENLQAFGILFELPEPTYLGADVKPITLKELIHKTYKTRKLAPSLDARFKLAFSLAQSVLEFHLVGWLHKALTASNVAFFPISDQPLSDCTAEPFIVGFNHSRPNEPFAYTEGLVETGEELYQHPTYLHGMVGYCSPYDYYSLGMILLEIGLWSPLSVIGEGISGTPNEKRLLFLKKRIGRLRHEMGRDYSEAVRMCLGGDFDGAESPDYDNNKLLFLRFEALVVSKVRGVRI